jgi:hypothetical protein
MALQPAGLEGVGEFAQERPERPREEVRERLHNEMDHLVLLGVVGDGAGVVRRRIGDLVDVLRVVCDEGGLWFHAAS